MLAVMVGIIAVAEGLTVAQILKSSSCFTCMSKKQMIQALVTIMGSSMLGESDTVPEVIQKVKCLECASDKQLLAALLYLFCNVLDVRGQ